MTTQKHSRNPRPTTATQADGNAQEAQADHSDAPSAGTEWRPPTQEEHKRLLREAGCASDIFTARTPEELHAIADAELEEMTTKPMPQHGEELLESWVLFNDEMMCWEINDCPMIHYLHRDATDDFVSPGKDNVRLQDKIEDTLKTALFHCLNAGGKPEMWTLEQLLQKHKTEGRPTNRPQWEQIIRELIQELIDKLTRRQSKRKVEPVTKHAQEEAVRLWEHWNHVRQGTDYGGGKADKRGCFEYHRVKLMSLGISDWKHFVKVLDTARKTFGK